MQYLYWKNEGGLFKAAVSKEMELQMWGKQFHFLTAALKCYLHIYNVIYSWQNGWTSLVSEYNILQMELLSCKTPCEEKHSQNWIPSSYGDDDLASILVKGIYVVYTQL